MFTFGEAWGQSPSEFHAQNILSYISKLMMGDLSVYNPPPQYRTLHRTSPGHSVARTMHWNVRKTSCACERLSLSRSATSWRRNDTCKPSGSCKQLQPVMTSSCLTVSLSAFDPPVVDDEVLDNGFPDDEAFGE